MKAQVRVTLRGGILDPQGKAVEHSLASLGFSSIKNVRVGKYIELELDAKDSESAKKSVEEMCEKLLSNPVTENFDVKVI
ncbi:MAG: phosphoribosylformylglycinamidine synthase subunit PurS [Nitrospinota bacterium]|nr:phosphoribosylformylglycinamidine synthase subunit PurS [Nitrospinota bacterium]